MYNEIYDDYFYESSVPQYDDDSWWIDPDEPFVDDDEDEFGEWADPDAEPEDEDEEED